MKKITVSSIMLLSLFFSVSFAQMRPIANRPVKIQDNLDLKAIATILGRVKNVEEFEIRLNSSSQPVSNLDLNKDGYVDYLRVVEINRRNIHLLTIQAIVGDHLFQNVANIDVIRDNQGRMHVQVVGDAYLYGNNYIIEPIYARTPILFSWFWSSTYRTWKSPYYWQHFPPHFRYYKPSPASHYQSHVREYTKNVQNTYNHSSQRQSPKAERLEKRHSKNDYARQYPKNSYDSRNGNSRRY